MRGTAIVHMDGIGGGKRAGGMMLLAYRMMVLGQAVRRAGAVSEGHSDGRGQHADGIKGSDDRGRAPPPHFG